MIVAPKIATAVLVVLANAAKTRFANVAITANAVLVVTVIAAKTRFANVAIIANAGPIANVPQKINAAMLASVFKEAATVITVTNSLLFS